MPTLEMLASALGAAAVVPPLLYLWAIASLERHHKPVLSVLGTFLLGAFSIHLLRLIRPPFGAAAEMIDAPLLTALAQAFLGIAVPEEAVKAAVLILFSYRFMTAGRPIDGVLYGAAAGLGFAAAENLWYFMNQADQWEDHYLARTLATVPVHASLGIVAGIYIGRVATPLTSPPPALLKRIKAYIVAWTAAAMLHGLYDLPQLLIRGDLRPGPLAPSVSRPALNALVLLAGLTVILVAARFASGAVGSEGGHHALARAIPSAKHHPWHLDLLGAIASLVGALALLIELRAWLRGDTFSLDEHFITLVGAALIALAVFLHRRAAPPSRKAI